VGIAITTKRLTLTPSRPEDADEIGNRRVGAGLVPTAEEVAGEQV